MTSTHGPSTANIADACLRLGVSYSAISSLRPASSRCEFQGKARPVRHFGSVDVFLEVIDQASPGDVLVVDNDGRDDEGCIGDLVTLEAATAGLAAIVIWGRHRDTADLQSIPITLFSQGSSPSGPRRLDPCPSGECEFARIGEVRVGRDDMVIGDADGLVVLPAGSFDDVSALALHIRSVEALQAERMRSGSSLREQLDWQGYAERRRANADFTFRQHLAEIGGAVET
jgi:regulator of RNase E activity RraA